MHSALKIMKYLRINQWKYKTRKKEIEGDMGQQKNISMFMYQKRTLLKMATLCSSCQHTKGNHYRTRKTNKQTNKP